MIDSKVLPSNDFLRNWLANVDFLPSSLPCIPKTKLFDLWSYIKNGESHSDFSLRNIGNGIYHLIFRCSDNFYNSVLFCVIDYCMYGYNQNTFQKI